MKVLGILLVLLLAWLGQAWAYTFKDVPPSSYEEILIQTEDGVTEKLIHLKNPGKPIVLLEPGLGAQATSLELPAATFFLKGDYDVFIGNWRGSAKIEGAEEKGLKLLGEVNGLPEVVRRDFPAHLRYILNQYATAEQKKIGISLLGHSMGGMMIMGTLSDANLREEFKPFIRSILLLQSPHHLKYLPFWIRFASGQVLPLLEYMKEKGIRTVDVHSRGLHMTKQAKEFGRLHSRVMAAALENIVIALAHTAFSPTHAGRQSFRRVFFKMQAEQIPVDLLLDFARAVKNNGVFMDREGRPLIQPGMVRGIPVVLLRTKLDRLAPWKQMGEYYGELGTAEKRQIDIRDMGHIGPVILSNTEANFYHHTLDFLKDPFAFTETDEPIVFDPCPSLLTKLKIRFSPGK